MLPYRIMRKSHSKKMIALDLFCGGGGACKGLLDYFDEVVGYDVDNQSKYYPGTFIQGDVMSLKAIDIEDFDFIWASPPCQRYSTATKRWGVSGNHPDLVDPVRTLLKDSKVPFVMENVPGSPLIQDLMLCGLMVGLPLIRRHRIFEISGFDVPQPDHPKHVKGSKYITVAGHPGGKSTRDGSDGRGSTQEWKDAMGIDWLPSRLLAEAVPPAYSRFIASYF